jgi:hypothetical protein
MITIMRNEICPAKPSAMSASSPLGRLPHITASTISAVTLSRFSPMTGSAKRTSSRSAEGAASGAPGSASAVVLGGMRPL